MINQKEFIQEINQELGFRIPSKYNVLDYNKNRMIEHIAFWIFHEDRLNHRNWGLFIQFFRDQSDEEIREILLESGIDIDSIPNFQSNHNMRILRFFESILGFNIGFNKEFLDYGREELIRFFSWKIFYHDLKGKRLDEEIESLFNEMDPRDILIESGFKNPELIQMNIFFDKNEN